jgi:hypothetical protein
VLTPYHCLQSPVPHVLVPYQHSIMRTGPRNLSASHDPGLPGVSVTPLREYRMTPVLADASRYGLAVDVLG